MSYRCAAARGRIMTAMARIRAPATPLIAMPIRFSTLAANADKMDGDDGASTPQATATAPRKPFQAGRPPEDASAAPDAADAAKPGKDINAPGFIKERDPKP